MDGFDVNQFLALPSDMKRDIISFITHPRQIMEYSSQSVYLRELLYQSVTHLNTDDDPEYLNINWLKLYPFLKEVSDNIIFSFNMKHDTEIKIPRNLRKFNFRILVDNVVNLEQISDIIYNLLRHLRDNNIDFRIPGLQQYTVRVMINNVNREYKDTAFIIDQGYIAFFNDLSPNNLFAERMNLDRNQIFDRLGILISESPVDSDDVLYLYYMSYTEQNKDGTITTYIGEGVDEMFIKEAKYPQPLFRNFINDINQEIRVDLKGYSLTRYIAFDLLTLITVYLNAIIPGPGSWTPEFVKSFNIAKYIDFETLKRFSDHGIEQYLRPILFSPDRNVIISHLYLTEPLIMQIIKQDKFNLHLKWSQQKGINIENYIQ